MSVAAPVVRVLEAVQLYWPESENCKSHRFSTDTVKYLNWLDRLLSVML